VAKGNQAEMEKKKKVLNKIVNPRSDIKLIHGDYALTFKPDGSVRYPFGWPENNWFLCKFLIQGTAHYPFWKLRQGRVYRESRVQGLPLWPLVIPEGVGLAYGYIPALTVNNPNNEGDVDAGFVLRITAARGPVTNPKVLNRKSQEFIEVIVSLGMGDDLEISTAPSEKYIKLFIEGHEIDIFNQATKQSTYGMTLHPGVNDLSVTAVGNAANMDYFISLSPSFLEVQR
jgi:hypothetical protein